MLKRSEALGWILCLAALSVGARNFESGISLDGPLYATIARNIVRGGDWFWLRGDVPDFQPIFAEHPHLGFWLIALVFKFLPIADWSARIVGHFFYVAFLWMFFLNVRNISGERVAGGATLLLWIWYQFSNTCSNVYLDPGTLFFGAAGVFLVRRALEENRARFAVAAGVALAACAMYKGLTVLGFLPAVAWLFWRVKSFRTFRAAWTVLASFCAVAAIYVLAVKSSSVPNFFDVYWDRQMTHRFGPGWSLVRLFETGFWKELLRYTYYLAPFAILPILRRTETAALPAILAGTFILMYAPVGLWGGQYLVTLLPGVAWLLALALPRRGPGGREISFYRIARATGLFAFCAVAVLQYFPVRLHGGGDSDFKGELRRLSQSSPSRLTRRFYMETPGVWPPFLVSASYAWYGDVVVNYANLEKFPEPTNGDSLISTSTLWATRAKARGWCRHATFDEGTLWIFRDPCPSGDGDKEGG